MQVGASTLKPLPPSICASQGLLGVAIMCAKFAQTGFPKGRGGVGKTACGESCGLWSLRPSWCASFGHGIRPHACDWLEREAALENARPVWRGSGVSSFEQGVKILGTPLGHPDYVRAQLECSSVDHQRLLDRIPSVPDVQAPWLILLHCTQARANYLVRVVRPDAVRSFAQRHDDRLYQCLCGILQIDPMQCAHEARESFPHSLSTAALASGIFIA